MVYSTCPSHSHFLCSNVRSLPGSWPWTHFLSVATVIPLNHAWSLASSTDLGWLTTVLLHYILYPLTIFPGTQMVLVCFKRALWRTTYLFSDHCKHITLLPSPVNVKKAWNPGQSPGTLCVKLNIGRTGKEPCPASAPYSISTAARRNTTWPSSARPTSDLINEDHYYSKYT